ASLHKSSTRARNVAGLSQNHQRYLFGRYLDELDSEKLSCRIEIKAEAGVREGRTIAARLFEGIADNESLAAVAQSDYAGHRGRTAVVILNRQRNPRMALSQNLKLPIFLHRRARQFAEVVHVDDGRSSVDQHPTLNSPSNARIGDISQVDRSGFTQRGQIA